MNAWFTYKNHSKEEMEKHLKQKIPWLWLPALNFSGYWSLHLWLVHLAKLLRLAWCSWLTIIPSTSNPFLWVGIAKTHHPTYHSIKNTTHTNQGKKTTKNQQQKKHSTKKWKKNIRKKRKSLSNKNKKFLQQDHQVTLSVQSLLPHHFDTSPTPKAKPFRCWLKPWVADARVGKPPHPIFPRSCGAERIPGESGYLEFRML